MTNATARRTVESLQPGDDLGTSPWIAVTQEMIDGFGAITSDLDPIHVDPVWAQKNGPFGGTIAFGFLTVSLLTHLLHGAVGNAPDGDPQASGYYLNYGFDRLRLVSPVRAGKAVRGHFRLTDRTRDARQRLMMTFHCTVEIEGEERPALVADWLTVWVPPEA